MDPGDYVIPLLMLLLIIMQVVTGHAFKPRRLRVEFVSRSRNPLVYRTLIIFWIAATILCAVVMFVVNEF